MILIQLQKKIFANGQPIKAKIKEHSGNIVTDHHEAMKEQLELAIAMSEMANSALTRASDHDIACRIVEFGRNAYPKAKFANACEGLQLAAVFQSAKTAIDNGETLNIDILPTYIFLPKTSDGPGPESPHAAMVASSANQQPKKYDGSPEPQQDPERLLLPEGRHTMASAGMLKNASRNNTRQKIRPL